MREARFVALNKNKWKEMEKWQELDSEALAANFMELSDDLAYARTFYPGSDSERYLNQLISHYQVSVNSGSVERKRNLASFWKQDFPLLLASQYRTFLFAFLVFILSVALGAFSAAHDMDFLRLIVGDSYVNMTLDNIAAGKPMGVYDSQDEWNMFVQITVNNIKVSFNAFVFGLLFSVGTVWFLFFNGIMLGAFQYFFFQHHLLFHSMLSLWAHGTFEITAIIIAGGAGLIMGNSFLFPGTYTRLYSFRRGALTGIKVVVGLIPFFIIAGWIESFITRYADATPVVGAVCVLLSVIGVIFYFVVYPYRLYRKCNKNISDGED